MKTITLKVVTITPRSFSTLPEEERPFSRQTRIYENITHKKASCINYLPSLKPKSLNAEDGHAFLEL